MNMSVRCLGTQMRLSCFFLTGVTGVGCVCLWVSFCVILCVCLPLCLYVYTYVYLYAFLPIYLGLWVSVCVCTHS